MNNLDTKQKIISLDKSLTKLETTVSALEEKVILLTQFNERRIHDIQLDLKEMKLSLHKIEQTSSYAKGVVWLILLIVGMLTPHLIKYILAI